MKISFVTLLLILSGTIASQAQTFADVFEYQTEIVWLGLDFTELKIIGDKAAWKEREPQQMYEAWNQLMINEAAKYDVAAALHKGKVKNAVQIAMEHNNDLRLDESNIFKYQSSPEFELTSEKIASIIGSYDYRDNKGIGFMLVMETFDKPSVSASMWAVFIDLKTKKQLFAERMVGKAGGFGLRNYWASGIHNVLEKIKSTEYRRWSTSSKKQD